MSDKDCSNKKDLLYTVFNNSCTTAINRLGNVSYLIKTIGASLFIGYTTIIFTINFSSEISFSMIFIGALIINLYFWFLDSMILINENRLRNLQEMKNQRYDDIDIQEITKINPKDYIYDSNNNKIKKLFFWNSFKSYSQLIWLLLSILITTFFVVLFFI